MWQGCPLHVGRAACSGGGKRRGQPWTCMGVKRMALLAMLPFSIKLLRLKGLQDILKLYLSRQENTCNLVKFVLLIYNLYLNLRLKSCLRPCGDRVPDRFVSTQSGPPSGNTEITGTELRGEIQPQHRSSASCATHSGERATPGGCQCFSFCRVSSQRADCSERSLLTQEQHSRD